MWEEILGLVTGGSMFGLPTVAFMTVPFIAGLIVGFLLKKVLRIALILLIIVGAGIYFGVFSVSFDQLKRFISIVEPAAQHAAAFLIGVLPLSAGLIVGLILGFRYG